ncbi:AAA family ATPase [Jiella sp. M17.18]|uniref:bifunctional aminoglycoside phosphotransferase/ATP-binding protein n=1 Tax=Jiella sp. M17.18 TaxID=3234247 RepID=UPI0034DFD1CA
MQDEATQKTIAFLKAHAFGRLSAESVETATTHISIILLSGETAIKLKRPVKLGYVDFSTPEKRLIACERELELNRRTAPTLYRAVRRITRGRDGGLEFDDDGELVDAVVEMRRFDEGCLFDRMAETGGLTVPLVTRLGETIAAFHAAAEVATDRSGSAVMASVLDINEAALATTDVFVKDAVAEFNASFRAALASRSPLLDARGRAARIRRCHGDLHLRNICLFEGEPTLFDCLEFDEAMATTDVLYDLAFLLMDLWHRGLCDHANRVMNRYLDASDEADGLPLMPFFMAVRAAVRAHVTATRAAETDGDQALYDEAHAYFDLALTLLEERPARLVAVGGLSGSGKSTVAAALAPHLGSAPGARILASDRLRKRRYGVAAETRLPPEAYASGVSEQVYAELADTAARILSSGWSVVADAVFDRGPDRQRIAAVAERAGVPFQGLWLEAPVDELVKRVSARRGDPSDATAAVVRMQAEQPRSVVEWRHVPSEGGIARTCEAAKSALER